MTTSSRIRECIDYLNQAYFDLAMTPKKNSYHWKIKGQVADKMFELENLLTEVDQHEAAYANTLGAAAAMRLLETPDMPPAG